MKNINEISGTIIEKAIEVHRVLGPGLLESAYLECLYWELKEAGLVVFKEHPLPLQYKEIYLDCGYRLDLFVENCFVVELKTVEAFTPLHLAQAISYLRLTETSVGLMLNFRVKRMINGIKRVVYNYEPR